MCILADQKTKLVGMVKNSETEIKDEILEEAQKLFRQFGLKKTTMDEIATACGKAKSTLYHYFKSKEEVFDEVLSKELTDLRTQVRSKVVENKTVVKKMGAYVFEFHQQVKEKANLYRLIKFEPSGNVSYHKHYLSMMKFEQDYISRILADGIDGGELPHISKDDIEWLAEFFCSSFLGFVRHSIEKDGFIEDEKLKKAIDLFIPRMF